MSHYDNRPRPQQPYGGEHHGSARAKRPPQKPQMPTLYVVLIDVAVFAVALLIFAYFHHVRPDTLTPVALGTPTPAPVETAAPQEPSAAPQDSAQPDETVAPQPTVDPATLGLFGAKFADKFVDGEPVKTDTGYQSKNVNVQVEKVQRDGITYYVADVYVRNLENFRTAFANDEVKTGTSEAPLAIATRNKAVVSITGDYFGIRKEGIVVRNGTMYREKAFADIMVMYRDGSMKSIPQAEVKLEELKSPDVYQVWSFGPMLLTDGQAMEKFNSSVNPANPRSAVGYYEPGHYALVLVDGRQEGYSKGMTLKELSKLFADLGCKEAYNLDGGQSCTMTFGDAKMSQPYKGGRNVSDIIMIGEVEGQ
ncbi:MAG: phosphodiester glycosidase family protein [Eubacteriales bacterium]|nr:phosphodiester glycosidase family protein [Eubacteriales bacterium]